jgi:dihydrofolate reductase
MTTHTSRITVVSFTTLDGVVEDPDGRGGTPYGGWAFRYGPEGIAGDKFRLGDLYDTGTLLFGRRTWEHFATLWPTRTGDFPDAMNRARKVVLSSSAPPPAPGSTTSTASATSRSSAAAASCGPSPQRAVSTSTG